MKLSELNLIQGHLQKLGLPYDLKKYFKKKQLKRIIEYMKIDKKNFGNKINLILVKKIGNTPSITSFKASEIKNFLIKKLN